uniref:Uncharacterized protein n=1 Tax=Avena sativa TaxID=4498 RepID=A0ACD5XG04_AVESA
MIHQQDEGSSSSVTSSPLQNFSNMPLHPATAASTPPWMLRELRSDERGLCLIHLLLNCAAVAVARRHFLDLCPFLRLAGAAANQAVLEAMESEKIVHVIDLGGADAAQWLELLHLLAARPEGPPHFRLTAVHEHKDLLAQTAMVLTKEAERLDVPFQFNPVATRLDALDVESLRVKTGEALAITSSLQLHRLLATDDDTSTTVVDKEKRGRSSPEDSSGLLSPSTSRADAFLGALWGLSPKIMVVTEQEASHNTPGLTERFVEALNYYAALFDCLEVGAARGSVERARVERWLLGEEIKNIVACDGAERRERHERHERWAARMEGAGFGRVPLSYYSLLQARRAAQGLGCDGFKVREEKGVFFLCWQDRALFSVSAWRGRRFD